MMNDAIREEIREIIRTEIKTLLKEEQKLLREDLVSEFNSTFEKRSNELVRKMEKIVLYNLPLVLAKPGE